MLNIAIFGSGRGSNLQVIVDSIQQKKIPGARICLVLSNNSKAGILAIARSHGIAAIHATTKHHANENEFAEYLLTTLNQHDTNFIALAGYMKRLHPRVIESYRNRIINIHPALLPKFGGQGMYGAHVHEAVIAAGEKVSGATVHLVDEEYDHGSIVIQEKVVVDENDSPETLAAKVLQVEHRLYPKALKLFAEGKVIVNQKNVVVQGS